MEEKDQILPEEPIAEEIPLEELPACEIPEVEAPMEVTHEGMPAEETASEEVLAQEVPIEEVSVEETPVEEASAEEAPVDEDPIEETPIEEAPIEEDPIEEAPGEENPMEEAPVEEAPVEEAPVEEASVEDVAVEDAPTEEAPAEELAPIQEVPAEPAQPFDLNVLEDPDLTPEEPAEAEAASPEFPDQAFRGESEEFQQAFNAPTEEKPQVPVHDRPARKGRPKRKKGYGLFGIPHLLVTVVWLAIIVFVGVTLGRMLWVCAAEVLAFGRPDKVVSVTIYESDTIDEVTEKLHKAGLIRYPGLFKLYADLAVDEGEIDPGIWDLNTRYDYHALVNAMNTSSSRAIIEDLLIPEGYTCQQIFELLEEKKVCTARDLEAYAASGELKDYWFLEDTQRGTANCLEGYLFPDTYDFYKNSSPREVLEKLLDNFNNKFNEELQAQISTLNDHISGLMRRDGRSEETIAKSLFTIREVIIVASLIEKETASNDESYTIASVIYNRLFNWGSTPAFLNIDASIIYAQGGDAEFIDTKLDSPYNTYLHTGLTPGAIANPGLASIKAALNPESTNYYFYVLNPETGRHKFSTTLQEHEANVRQFAEINK